MRITYDPRADAVYFYLAKRADQPDTHVVNDDVYIDFDAQGRLVGLEVLDASKRLDLECLLPVCEIMGEEEIGWHKLWVELLRRKPAGLPVDTPGRDAKQWIKEVRKDYVVLCSEQTGIQYIIVPLELEQGHVATDIVKRRIIKALRALGGYSSHTEDT